MPKLVRLPLPDPATARHAPQRPSGPPGVREIRAILRETLKRAPPTEFLSGPAGLEGTLEQWWQYFSRERPRRKPPRNLLAKVTESYIRELEEIAPTHPGEAMLREHIAELRARLETWPYGQARNVLPAWQQAATTIEGNIRAALAESDPDKTPRGEALMTAVWRLLMRIGVELKDAEVIRNGINRWRERNAPTTSL